ILQDILGNVYAPFKETNWLPGSIFASAAVSCAWGYMVYTGDVPSVWPLFGTANQLLAVLALCIGTTIILKIAPQKKYSLVTFLPMVLLAVTVITAAAANVRMYLNTGKTLNAGLSIIFIALVVVIILDNVRLWLQLFKTGKPVGMKLD
ncbi:MAG: carbon starvation CstA 5TM domain-containing protein, partial [Bacillota bacterium]